MNDKKESSFAHSGASLMRNHKRAAQGDMQETYTDRFGHCAGTSCMAYKNGHCLRLEKSEEL